MREIVLAAVLGLCAASPALALNVHLCKADDPTDAGAIMEPWEKNAKAFYNGNVRVALIDTGGEPVCCSEHLMILVPNPQDETGGRACYMVDNQGSLGFAGIDFARLTTRYDAGKGLLITFPYMLYNEGNPGKGGTAHVRVNVATGKAAAE